MIGTRLGPSLPPGPDLVRGARGDAAGPAATLDAGRTPGARDPAGRSDVERASPRDRDIERSARNDRSERGRDRTQSTERGERATRNGHADRSERANRSGHADRNERTGRADRADRDEDSFERMLDRDGPQTAEAPRAATPDPSRSPETAPASAGGTSAAPPPDALPTQLLALLSTLAPDGGPGSAGPISGASTVDAAAAGAAQAVPAALTAARLAAATGAALAATPAATAQAAGSSTAIDSAFALAALASDASGAGADPLPDTLAPLERTTEATPFTLSTAAPSALTRTAAVPTVATVALPADPQAGFDDAFGSRIVWMAEQRLGHADIRVTPDHLGTIDVRLQLDGAKVSAEFYSQQPEVRQALEASFGRLRDLLGQQGLQLTHADVGQQRSGQGDAKGTDPASASADAEPPATTPAAIRSRRLLDEIA